MRQTRRIKSGNISSLISRVCVCERKKKKLVHQTAGIFINRSYSSRLRRIAYYGTKFILILTEEQRVVLAQ